MGCTSDMAFASRVSSATLTVLPNTFLNCPYSTPVSELSWELSQRLLLFILHLFHGLGDLSLRYRTKEPSRWTQWREAANSQIMELRNWLEHGLQKSITLNAINAPSTTGEDTHSWTLTVLDDDWELEDFVSRVPGFFESASLKDASSIMLSVISDQPTPNQSSPQDQVDPVLGSRINNLLKTCVPGTSPLKEELRRNRLHVCMKTF